MIKTAFSGRESLARNLVANTGAYWASVIIAFVISPFIIRTLGDARYGVWALVNELAGYYGLLDLGLRGAVVYFVASHVARGDDEAFRNTVSSAFWTLCGLGLVVLGVGLGLVAAFPYLLDTRGLEIGEVRLALFIMSLLLAVSLPIEVFNSILTGLRRIDLAGGIEVVTRVATALATYYVLRAGGGLVGLSLVNLGGRLLSWLLICWAVRTRCGGLFLSPWDFRKSKLAELASYGLRNVVGNTAVFLTYRSSNLIIGFFMGVKWVTYYTIGSMAVSYASAGCSTITRAFTPHFTHLRAREENDELLRLYLAGVRLSGLLAVGLTAGLTCFAHDFLTLWVGAKYVVGPWTERSDIVMLILLLGHLPRLIQSISWQLLYAAARVRFLMWMNISEAVGKLVIAILAVKPLGMAGVAFGVLVPVAITHLFFLPSYVLREFSLPASQFIREGVGRPLLVGAAMLAVGVVLTRVHRPTNWALFAAEVALVCGAAAVLTWTIGLTTDDRALALKKLGRGAALPAGPR